MTERLQPPRPRLELVPPEADILQQQANPVELSEIGTPELEEIIDGMLEIAYGEQGDAQRPTLVGLAAPQAGIKKRIVIIDVLADGMGGEEKDFQVFINPEIIEQSDELEEGREGCYSTGRVCGVVNRSKRIVIRSLDRQGNEVITELHDFPARVGQHEIDHLDGIRFPQRVSDDRKLHKVPKDDFGRYRQEWATWQILYPRDEVNRLLNLPAV